MYFLFLKILILYTVLVFLVAGAFNAITNYTVSCDENGEECESNIFIMSSIFSKTTAGDSANIQIVDILHLVTVCISIVFCGLCQKYQFAVFNEIDRKIYTQQDYTIFVDNIPQYIPFVTDSKGRRVINYAQNLKQALEDKLDQWHKAIIEKQGQGNYLTESMYKLLLQPNFKQLPKVRSISLCSDISEIINLRAAREELMKICHNALD